MIPGETIGSGASQTCDPYSRESVYYLTKEEAERRFADNSWERRS